MYEDGCEKGMRQSQIEPSLVSIRGLAHPLQVIVHLRSIIFKDHALDNSHLQSGRSVTDEYKMHHISVDTGAVG
jgi:hypothetical protein